MRFHDAGIIGKLFRLDQPDPIVVGRIRQIFASSRYSGKGANALGIFPSDRRDDSLHQTTNQRTTIGMTSSNKIAIVTGGSRGLGRNTAISLARNGCDIILTYHSNANEGESAVAEIAALERKGIALQVDAGNVASFDKFAKTIKLTLFEQWGRDRFDFLINNAGTGLAAPFSETTEEAFD